MISPAPVQGCNKNWKSHEFLSICKAMIKTGIKPDFIAVDGSEGGTGAAPPEFSNSVGMPQKEGLAFVYDALCGFDLKKDITFETWVTDARYDEDNQCWTIETSTGETCTAQFLVCAVGALFVANKPDYPGIDDFSGPIYHTGRWPHEKVSFEGKRMQLARNEPLDVEGVEPPTLRNARA